MRRQLHTENNDDLVFTLELCSSFAYLPTYMSHLSTAEDLCRRLALKTAPVRAKPRSGTQGDGGDLDFVDRCSRIRGFVGKFVEGVVN